MKPLVRWTIGPVSDIGFEILRESIRLFSEVYPEFDQVVLYNHIDPKKIQDLSNTVPQESHFVPCTIAEPAQNEDEAIGCGWKLVPPRLRMDSHELFIDNDLIIRERISQIDDWIQSSSCLISEGLHRRRMFGVFDSVIPAEVRACAGLFGLPPGFDFGRQIASYASLMEGRPLGGYDEQGLTTAIVVNSGSYVLVPLSQVHIAEDHVEFPRPIPPAVHFVAANRKPWHRGWEFYKRISRRRILFL